MSRFPAKALFILLTALLLSEQVCADEPVVNDGESVEEGMVASSSSLLVRTTDLIEGDSQTSSAVKESGAEALLTASTPGLPTAAGVCSVVDAFVQQFCIANPNDISCQFQ